MLRTILMKFCDGYISRLALRVPVAPNTISVIGIFFAVLAIPFIFFGWDYAAAGIIFLNALCDVLDGAVAKAQGGVSSFGAFLDSVADRVSELLVFIALTGHFYFTDDDTGGFLSVWALGLAMLASYIKARADAIGAGCFVDTAGRTERIILIMAGLISGYMKISLFLVAAISLITALQCLGRVYRNAAA